MKICTFASGSSGNCTFVTNGDTSILIDAGISLRRIKYSLQPHGVSPDQLAGVLITHEHSDHIAALKMLAKYHPNIPVFASCAAAVQLLRQVPELEKNMRCFDAGSSFVLDGFFIKSFQTPHDTPESVGYRIEDGHRSFALATDLGFVPQPVYDAVCGADMAVLESNHDVEMLKNGKYPYYLKKRILANRGHLSNADCASFAAALLHTGTKQIVLAHLSRENNTPRLAYTTVGSALAKTGATLGEDVQLTVAPANEAGPCYII